MCDCRYLVITSPDLTERVSCNIDIRALIISMVAITHLVQCIIFNSCV